MYRDDDTEKPNQWLEDAKSRSMRVELVRFFDSCHGVILELLSAVAEEVGLPSETFHPFYWREESFYRLLALSRYRAGVIPDSGSLRRSYGLWMYDSAV